MFSRHPWSMRANKLLIHIILIIDDSLRNTTKVCTKLTKVKKIKAKGTQFLFSIQQSKWRPFLPGWPHYRPRPPRLEAGARKPFGKGFLIFSSGTRSPHSDAIHTRLGFPQEGFRRCNHGNLCSRCSEELESQVPEGGHRRAINSTERLNVS